MREVIKCGGVQYARWRYNGFAQFSLALCFNGRHILFHAVETPEKEQQKRQDLLNSLKEGDEIITIGGIYGKITAISEKRVKVEIAEGVVIEMARNAVSGFQNPAKNS